MPRPATRATATPASAPAPLPVPTLAPAAPAPRLDRSSATLIPADTPRASLPCMIRTQLGTPPVCDPARVFTTDDRSCSEGDRVELAHRLSGIVAQFQPAPGAQEWLQAMRDAEATERSHRGAGSAAFRHKAAKAILAEHAVLLALHHGVLMASDNCVLLQEAGERAAETGIEKGVSNMALSTVDPGASTGADTSTATARTDATASTAAAAAAGASSQYMGGMIEGSGDRALVDLLLTQHKNPEMHTVLSPLLKLMRNADGRATWFDFDQQLCVAAELTFDLGLTEERRILDSVMFRGKRLLDQGSDPAQVLFLFTEKLPNARGVDRAQLALDKVGMKALVKARKGVGGGGSAPAPVHARAPVYRAAARSSGRASYPSTAPHQGPPQAPVQGYAVPKGAPRATSASGYTSARGQGRGGRAHSGRGGGGQPRGPLANRDLQEIERRNRQLEELQQTFQRVPGAPTCDNCTRAGRNPHHDYKRCAFSVCRLCKLGGHRANVCP